MIHVVTSDNQHLYANQLDEMFRMRHDYYVRDHGWNALVGINGRETDEFDNDDAVYLISLDSAGHVAAAMRLNPTTSANLLANKLASYVDGPPPRARQIWDMTRWIVAPRYRRDRRNRHQLTPGQELGCGLMEFAMTRDLTHFTTIAETALIPRLTDLGWNFETLGSPHSYDSGKGVAQALLIDAGPEALIQARALVGVTSPVLFEVKPKISAITTQARAAEMEEDAIAAAMHAAGRDNARRIVQELADELATRAVSDPASAIALVHSFNAALAERLSRTTLPEEAQSSTPSDTASTPPPRPHIDTSKTPLNTRTAN